MALKMTGGSSGMRNLDAIVAMPEPIAQPIKRTEGNGTPSNVQWCQNTANRTGRPGGIQETDPHMPTSGTEAESFNG